MKKPNITFTTALFDIGRDKLPEGFRRGFDHYIECFEKLLKIEYPMVIYIQPEYEHIVWKHRKRENTRVILKTLDDIKKFPFYDQVQKIRINHEWKTQAGWLEHSPQSRLELYNPLVMMKQFFLNDVSLFNHFDTKYYLWIDAGISNTIGNPIDWINADFEKKITPKMKNKMLFLAFPYDSSTNEVHGFKRAEMTRFAGKVTEYVCRGGLFGGNKDSINSWNDYYYSLLNDSLNSGCMGTEESLFTILSYKYPEKCNVEFIESNGLIVTFLNKLKQEEIQKEPEYPLAFYVLTYNTPSEFRKFVESFKKAYPEDFKKHKKYVCDNSIEEKAKEEYRKLFKENNFEIIHEGTNVGIQDGRQIIAEHFDKSDHLYYIFFEEDIVLIDKNHPLQNNRGFITYIPDIFNKMIYIMDENKFDYLRMTIIEFYGDATSDWSFKNLPANKREEYFPPREDGNEELRWKSKVDYLNIYKDVAYASGHFHSRNWPILFCKRGNWQVYLDIKYEHLFEQTICSQTKMHMMAGKLKVGCLLAAPVIHDRRIFYNGKERRENRHYSN